MIKFYDTCSLLNSINDLVDNNQYFIISSITLEELENIKTSLKKDADTKYKARKAIHLLDSYKNYSVQIYKTSMDETIVSNNLPVNNDSKILVCAKYIKEKIDDDFTFVTDDLNLKVLADKIFNFNTEQSIITESYCGYVEKYLTKEEVANFYCNLNDKTWEDIVVNQYVIIYFKDTKSLVDVFKWTGKEYEPLKFKKFDSFWFGEIKPKPFDPFQRCLADSLSNNQITLVRGPAGSGKSILSLGYLASLLNEGKIDKIIIFCNTIATRDAAKLGFYPGSKDEKLLDSQIGNFLASKLGGQVFVEKLIHEEKIVLLPMSDIRGYDTTGMRAGVYVTEAQNLSIDLLKLALQRVGEDCVCIIDGDEESQTDLDAFAGENNGIKRMLKIFKGEDFFGTVKLKNIYRSRIANIAEKM